MVNTLLKNLLNKSLMFSFCGSSVNEYVIYVPDAIFFILEDCVHHFLECGRGIRQSKWRHCILESSLLGAESCFPLVSRCNSDEVESVL